ncbi:MAG: 3-hydroxyacyl-CoA dehydrogenase [Pseudomonadota bacterium]
MSIACVGTGNVGRAWAIVFARAGHRVRLYDVDEGALNGALDAISRSVDSLASAGEVEDAKKLLGLIQPERSLPAALHGVEYVQESISERLSLKQAVFKELDQHCSPEVLLASSTSELAPSTFLTELEHPQRCLVAHPVNPPYLIPLVELCPGPDTSPAALDSAEALLTGCGMSCLRLKKEVNGFVMNRLQGALLREALRLTESGVCSPEDVDRALTEGLGRRWVFLGPFATGHLNSSTGFRGYMDMLGPAWRRLFDEMREDVTWSDTLVDGAADALAERYPEDAIAAAQAWRDKRLIQLNQHLNAQLNYKKD